MTDEEPLGTTPIPTANSTGGSVEVTLDIWSNSQKEAAQQPQTQQIAVYEPKLDESNINGSLLDVNQHFVVYAVKNGLIRVFHRHSSLKALLRGHQGQVVTDISFFLDGDVLATVGHDPTNSSVSKMIVWRVFEQSPEIQSEKLLEISTSEARMNRLLWHPFNPNQVWVMHSTNTNVPGLGNRHQVATLVETTRIQTTPHPEENHPVCHWHSPQVIMEGGVQLNVPGGGSLEDLAWSGRDTRHVLTAHANGKVILWDLKQTEDSLVHGVSVSVPKQLAVLQEPDSPMSRCLFLPHENAVRLEGQTDTITSCFVTASHNNTVVTLWSSFTSHSGLPVKLQVLKLANPSPSYVLDVCFGPAPQESSPPSCFLLWADRHNGTLLATHVASQWNAQHKALCIGGDYVVPFSLKHPIYSWSVVCAPTQDLTEEDIAEHAGLIFDMKLFSYQSKAVQCLTLTSYMCLPPELPYDQSSNNSQTVRVQSLTAEVPNDLGSIEPEYDEEYDVEDLDYNEDEEDDDLVVPPAAILPVPTANQGGASNPFANWLGAIAGTNNAEAPASMAPPPPPAPSSLPPPGLAGNKAPPVPPPPQMLLNPMNLLNEATEDKKGKDLIKTRDPSAVTQQAVGKSKSNATIGKGKNKNKKDSTVSPFPDGTKISILKRDDKVPASQPPKLSSTSVSPPIDPAILATTPALPVPPVSSATLETTMSRVVAQELAKQANVAEKIEETLALKIIPSVNKAVQESLASFGRPLQSSMDRLGSKGVTVDPKDLQAALDLEAPIKAAMASTIRNVLIPSLESITAQVIQKVTPPPPPANRDNEMQATLEALTKQLSLMNSKMDGMANEIKALKSGAAGSTPPVPPPPTPTAAPPPNQLEAVRSEVASLLQQKQFQAAFTKAVSTSSAEMSVWACSRANVKEVLGGNAPQLSQPILLCLMQQLSAAMTGTSSVEALKIELEWLQEIALSLNPVDASIQRHVPTVLQQLVGSVNQKITQGNPELRRPLQMLLQVIRGMQMV